jgi:two-component system cell cycle response regulator DivK
MQKGKADKYHPGDEINILIAEDEEYNYLFISEILSEYNVNVWRAYNGKMAVDLCASNSQINLVLMDVRMPVMDGYEATKKIKKLRPGLPIIAQTAFAMESDRKQAIDEGFDDYISKPVCHELLIDLIVKYAPADFELKRVRK